MSGLLVLAVDDERPALEDLAQLLRGTPEVGDVVLSSSGEDALRLLAERRFDAVFIDVRMPGMDGLQLAAVLGRFADPPALILVSAFEDGAVRAFGLDYQAVDYLMKPVSTARIAQALARVRAALEETTRPSDAGHPSGTALEADEIVPVEHQRGGATRLVPRSTILYVKGEGDYVRIVADNGRYLLRGALSDFERRWRPHGFVRVHRSYVANMRRAVEIRPELGGGATVVLADGSEIPVARRQVSDLRKRLRA
jgi:two-component system response regulator LytT